MTQSRFYERYWQKPGGSPADHGFLVGQRQALLKAALSDLLPGAAVLDAGCGSGEFIAFLESLGFRATGADISSSAIGQARQRCPGAAFQVAALEEGLPFDDRAFAAVWCSEVLEHVFDVHQALAEINRVLQQEGKLVLTTPYHGLAKNLVIALRGFDRHYDPYVSHIRFFSRATLAVCLRGAGFAVERWQGIGRRWPLWMSHFVVARKTAPPGPPPEIYG